MIRVLSSEASYETSLFDFSQSSKNKKSQKRVVGLPEEDHFSKQQLHIVSINIENFLPVSDQKFPHGLRGMM